MSTSVIAVQSKLTLFLYIIHIHTQNIKNTSYAAKIKWLPVQQLAAVWSRTQPEDSNRGNQYKVPIEPKEQGESSFHAPGQMKKTVVQGSSDKEKR